MSAEGVSHTMPVPARHRMRNRLILLSALLIAVVALVAALPGLGSLRTLLLHADLWWIGAGVLLKLLSGAGYTAAFRQVFCRKMSWRLSAQIGFSELGANALFPAGGAGGLALGAWALKRGGMEAQDISRRTVAFFLLTSLPNVVGVILIGLGLGLGLFSGEGNPLLTYLPAAVAALSIAGAIAAGRAAARRSARAEQAPQPRRSRRRELATGALRAFGEGVDGALLLLREGDAVLLAGLVAYLAFDVMVLWAAFQAIGTSPSIAILAMAYLIGELGGLIPSPGGIGGVDAGVAGTLVLYRVPVAAAAGATLAYRAICLWVPALAGAIAFRMLSRTMSEEPQEIAAAVPDAPEADPLVEADAVEAGCTPA